MQALTDRDRFECAFVAFSYLLEPRGSSPLSRLGVVGTAAKVLAAELVQSKRQARALALADGLTPIIEALERRRVQ